MYFEELNGKQITEQFPFIFEGENWIGEIVSEGELTFTPVFKVNTVQVRFTATSQVVLEELIKKYRYKTTRIGG